jgi:exonuclease SbcC
VLAAEAAVTEQHRQLKEAAVGLAHVPGEAEVHAAIADAERLAKQRQQAEDELVRAERDHADAQARVQAVAECLANARTALENARDRVAALDPPKIDRNDVAGAWRELMGWVDTEQRATAERRRAADSAQATVRAAHGQLERELRAAVIGLVPDEHQPIGALRDALAQARAEAAAAVGRFEAERARLDDLRARVGALREDAAVADSLGRLLSATGFEAWLMAAALEELCTRATTRLQALSGGRYSLVLVDREFLVRDHHNADELRNVRTLSGGETFLASLALALALAEATAELAPAGAPTIESIFLDEGFGTLDADTLDTVAAAIEDLGASGRMVAIVTHIRELAERMPVRLEVATAAGGSTVTRIDV